MCKAENISMVGIFSQAYTIQYSISVPNNDNNETKIDVSWKRDLSRIPKRFLENETTSIEVIEFCIIDDETIEYFKAQFSDTKNKL